MYEVVAVVFYKHDADLVGPFTSFASCEDFIQKEVDKISSKYDVRYITPCDGVWIGDYNEEQHKNIPLRFFIKHVIKPSSHKL